LDRVIHLVRTMAWLRWRLMLNSLRTARGLGETLARVWVILPGGLLALVGSAAAGLGVFSGLTAGGDLQNQRLVLGVAWTFIGILALVLPILLGEGRAELAPRRLLQFPLSRGDLFWTGMLGGVLSGVNLLWYPAMAATLVAAVVSGQVPPLLVFPAGLLATVSILATQQALLMGVQWIATNRRLREIATVLAVLFFVMLGQLPNILNLIHTSGQSKAAPLTARILLVSVKSLPPVLAVDLAVPDGFLDGLIGSVGLLVWMGLALGIAWKLYLAGLVRQSGSRKTTWKPRGIGLHHLEGLLSFLPPDVRALALKQLRYTFRSTSGRLALLMSPVLGLMLGIMQRGGSAVLLKLPIHDTVFLALCLMASINVFQLTANRFQWDGGGAVLYFVAPVDAAHVIFGLDVGLWLFQSLTGFGMLAAFVILSGFPGPGVLSSGLLLYLGGQILSLLGGSVLSILVPSPREIGTARNRLPLLSSLGMLVVSACTMLVFGMPALLLQWFFPSAAPPVLLVLLLAIVGAYRLLQPQIGRLLYQQREGLLAALKSRPG